MSDASMAGGAVFDAAADQAAPSTNGVAPLDALESLREQLAERDVEESEDRLTPVEVPGLGWRLLCATDFEFSQYAQWQQAALKAGQRAAVRAGQTSGRRSRPRPEDLMLKLDQAVLAVLVLVNTCEQVQYRADADWVTLYDEADDPVTLTSSTLLDRFNMVDPKVLVRRLFGRRDAPLVRAGEEVARAAGWIDDEEDGVDPMD